VICLGYVDDAALQWLYQNCFALACPSLFEGFGLPVLEAMSLGSVVIASNVSSIPEIVGDASLLVDPNSQQNIADAMFALASNPELHKRLKDQVRSQASRFNWKTTAQQVLQCYHQVLSEPKENK
jgi:glycosyltransferase involved in cell wall biosynthesis